MFDLSFPKLFVIGLIALFLLGPEKLPQYAATLGRWVRMARGVADEAKQRMRTEMGPEFDDLDWATLDPRRYSPRRILTDAWNAGPEPSASPAPAAPAFAADDEEPDLLLVAERAATERSTAVAPRADGSA